MAKRFWSRRSVRWTSLALLLVGLGVGGYCFLRFYIRLNFQEVVPGKVYRSALPDPEHLRQWKRDYDIRTVLSLRKSDSSGSPDEQAEANALGIRILFIPLSARRQPPREAVLRIIDVLEKEPTPILIHCRGGMERSGVVSALAAMALGGQDYETARKNVYYPLWRSSGEPGRIEDLLAAYEKHTTDPARRTWADFKSWAREEYHPTTSTAPTPDE